MTLAETRRGGGGGGGGRVAIPNDCEAPINC